MLIALIFALSAAAKLVGAEEMVLLFDEIGIGQWFRQVTGGVQLLGAVLLLAPRLTVYGALLLGSTMVGAIITHLFVLGDSPLVPALLLLILVGILWAEWRKRGGSRNS